MIANQFDIFLFDLDGVIYLGEEALPDAISAVNRLYERDKVIRFLTNDPRPTRDTIVARLRDLGIDTNENEIVTSAWATGAYLRQKSVSTVSVVGSEGLRTELREAGLTITDDNPETVVVGADEQTAYQDIRRAARHIYHGATFLGTNPDGSFPTSEGPIPGAGAIVRAVEIAAGTDPLVVGKPEPLMFEMALDGVPDDAYTVVVGDNPATDVLGAHRAGLTGILVAEDEPTATSTRDLQQPDGTIQTLADLFTDVADTWNTPSYSWPDEIRPGVGAVILNNAKEVLLLKRADKKQWALPTGTVEQCEPVQEAIVREIKEETGLTISVERLTGIYSHPDQQMFSYPSGKTVHFITNCFQCTTEGGNPEADKDEALEIGFFDTTDLPANMLSMQPQWIADATEMSESPAIR